jgi:L-threonylcarbamoyladenylate synthase
MPKVLPPTPENVRLAAEAIRAGGVVAFPTETVYGLGCDTFSEKAALEVYRMKGRPASNPLIAHVLDPAMARRVVIGWDVRCQKLADAFWPGPLTIVLPRRAEVSPSSIGGRSTVAVRSPAHPVARQLLELAGTAISAPSANRSGGVSPTRASHVADEFPDEADLMVLDGGDATVGLESTVLDLSRARPIVLRPGTISADAIERVLGTKVAESIAAGQGASPGTSPRHYAPRTRTELVDEAGLSLRLAACAEPVAVLAFDAAGVAPPHVTIEMPREAEAYASALYRCLREADALGGPLILVVRPPATGGLWTAIHDRLRRATA